MYLHIIQFYLLQLSIIIQNILDSIIPNVKYLYLIYNDCSREVVSSYITYIGTPGTQEISRYLHADAEWQVTTEAPFLP